MEAEDTTGCVEDSLRRRRILKGIEAQHPRTLCPTDVSCRQYDFKSGIVNKVDQSAINKSIDIKTIQSL